jgi:hypothetical protein
MVGEEEVTDINNINDLPQGAGKNDALKPKEIFEGGPHLELTQPSSRTVLEQTRRDLIVMREAYGADTPVGHRCSNIVELLQMPELPKALLARQMADLARLRAGLQ